MRRRSKSKKSKFRFSDLEQEEIKKAGGTSEYLTNCNYQSDCKTRTELIKKEYNYFLKPARVGFFSKPTVTVNEDIDQIGATSVNGFVLKIDYYKETVPISCLLKCSRTSPGNKPDNLFYEYYVGRYGINRFIEEGSTCFTETYHLYKFKHEDIYDYFSNFTPNLKPVRCNMKDIICRRRPRKKRSSTELFENLNLIPYESGLDAAKFGDDLCEDYHLYAVMVQYVDKTRSLHDFVSTKYNRITSDLERPDSFIMDLTSILMQIYFNLYELNGRFTHHDLHLGNILLVQAPKDQLYEFKFTYLRRDGRSVLKHYKSKYLVKFIDYGRCAYEIPGSPSSATIANLTFPTDPDKRINCGLDALSVVNPPLFGSVPSTNIVFIDGINNISDSWAYLIILVIMNQYPSDQKFFSLSRFVTKDQDIREACKSLFFNKDFEEPYINNPGVYDGLSITFPIDRIKDMLLPHIDTVNSYYNNYFYGSKIIKTYL